MAPVHSAGVITEIDIWRAAQLMAKRYGDQALKESAARATELTLAGDDDGAATWHRIMEAVTQLANTTPPGRCTDREGALGRPYRILDNYARHFDQGGTERVVGGPLPLCDRCGEEIALANG